MAVELSPSPKSRRDEESTLIARTAQAALTNAQMFAGDAEITDVAPANRVGQQHAVQVLSYAIEDGVYLAEAPGVEPDRVSRTTGQH